MPSSGVSGMPIDDRKRRRRIRKPLCFGGAFRQCGCRGRSSRSWIGSIAASGRLGCRHFVVHRFVRGVSLGFVLSCSSMVVPELGSRPRSVRWLRLCCQCCLVHGGENTNCHPTRHRLDGFDIFDSIIFSTTLTKWIPGSS